MTGLETIILLNTIMICSNTFIMFVNTKTIWKVTEYNA